MSQGHSHTLEKVFKSDTRQLENVRSFVESAARDFGFADEEVSNIILAVDEACTNIIKHAYGGRKNGDIRIEVLRSATSFSVRIQDHGKAFNPEGIEPPNLQKHLAEYRRGGLGVYLMRRMMDKVEYAIAPGKPNEVTLVKYRSESART